MKLLLYCFLKSIFRLMLPFFNIQVDAPSLFSHLISFTFLQVPWNSQDRKSNLNKTWPRSATSSTPSTHRTTSHSHFHCHWFPPPTPHSVTFRKNFRPSHVSPSPLYCSPHSPLSTLPLACLQILKWKLTLGFQWTCLFLQSHPILAHPRDMWFSRDISHQTLCVNQKKMCLHFAW